MTKAAIKVSIKPWFILCTSN